MGPDIVDHHGGCTSGYGMKKRFEFVKNLLPTPAISWTTGTYVTVGMCVRALKGKPLVLSTPQLVQR